MGRRGEGGGEREEEEEAQMEGRESGPPGVRLQAGFL